MENSKKLQDAVRRVNKFEKIFDSQRRLFDECDDLLSRLESSRREYVELRDYYTGEKYRADTTADENGEFPSDLKRGILGQDPIYDLMTDNMTTAVRMLEIATKMIKEY